MSDARTLLKARRQEARVNHPLASYTHTGQLRCVACDTNVKQGSSWEGHIGSKAHRINAGKLREVEQKEAERLRSESGKRKSVASNEGEDNDMPREMSNPKKPKLDLGGDITAQPSTPTAGGFPADFFSDPSQAPPLSSPDDEDEVEQASRTPLPGGTQTGQDVMDDEWQQFQQTVLNVTDEKEVYERATIFVEPMHISRAPMGFPTDRGNPNSPEGQPVPLVEEKRRQKEQDERELIMDRLVEEERAQEDADAKVLMLKQRLESLRKQREAAKEAKRGGARRM
jgi:zinc finger protein 830